MSDRAIDRAIQECVLGEADADLYSAAQITDLLAAYFIEDADAEAEAQLG